MARNDCICRMLTLSTAHVSRVTADLLDHADGPVYLKGDVGWFIPVLRDYPDGTPRDLLACLAFARAQGCDWLMLDRDGEILDDPALSIFDW